jgi:hypothetical protein
MVEAVKELQAPRHLTQLGKSLDANVLLLDAIGPMMRTRRRAATAMSGSGCAFIPQSMRRGRWLQLRHPKPPC